MTFFCSLISQNKPTNESFNFASRHNGSGKSPPLKLKAQSEFPRRRRRWRAQDRGDPNLSTRTTGTRDVGKEDGGEGKGENLLRDCFREKERGIKRTAFGCYLTSTTTTPFSSQKFWQSTFLLRAKKCRQGNPLCNGTFYRHSLLHKKKQTIMKSWLYFLNVFQAITIGG